MKPEIIKPLPDYGRPSTALARLMAFFRAGGHIPDGELANGYGSRAPKTEPATLPRTGRKWKVTFDVVKDGTACAEAVELESATAIDRRGAEQATRRAVKQHICRFTEFQILDV